jgi:hypothetical protein
MAVATYMFPQMPEISEVQSPILLVIIYDLLMIATGVFSYHYVVES